MDISFLFESVIISHSERYFLFIFINFLKNIPCVLDFDNNLHIQYIKKGKFKPSIINYALKNKYGN